MTGLWCYPLGYFDALKWKELTHRAFVSLTATRQVFRVTDRDTRRFSQREENGMHLEYGIGATACIQHKQEKLRQRRRKMKNREPLTSHQADTETNERELADFLQEAFVCISIPVAVFTFTYITLQTVIRLFLV
jgi:hypothetical protein